MQSTLCQQNLGHENQPVAEPSGVEAVVVLGLTVLGSPFLGALGLTVLGLTVAP